MNIAVDKVAADGLSKERFEFTPQGTTLIYSSYTILNRNSKKSKWPDEQPKPLSYERWSKLPSTIREHGHGADEVHYDAYVRSMNPVLQKTRDGRTKLQGVAAMIAHMPPCPASVAKKALGMFKDFASVIWEPKCSSSEK